MEFADVVTFIGSANADDKEKIALAAAPNYGTLKVEVEGLRAANTQLSEQNRALLAEKLAERKEAVIGKALSEGRILPKDRAAWEKRFDAAPDTIAEIVESLPKAVDLSERGTGAGGSEAVTLSDEEKKIADSLGLSEKEYATGKPDAPAKE